MLSQRQWIPGKRKRRSLALYPVVISQGVDRSTLLACKGDLDARGLQVGKEVRVPEDFYQLLMEEMAAEGSRISSF